MGIFAQFRPGCTHFLSLLSFQSVVTFSVLPNYESTSTSLPTSTKFYYFTLVLLLFCWLELGWKYCFIFHSGIGDNVTVLRSKRTQLGHFPLASPLSRIPDLSLKLMFLLTVILKHFLFLPQGMIS